MKATDSEIVDFFRSNQGNLTQERNDFLLPQIVDFVEKKRWVEVSPEYQRRLVWSRKKKSRLIESLLMNVPVPPVYLFERDFSRYEVMDGQQRINTIVEFYQNRLRLGSLDAWPILNGKTYADLPEYVQRGLDRRRIGATVIFSDLMNRDSGSSDIRRQVFDRLNTGGVQLNAQELRNCLFPGEFNRMLLRLSSLAKFTDAFGIPRHADHIVNRKVSEALTNNSMYRRMRDTEIVLRFFAFRKVSQLRGSIPKILDRCMERNLNINEAEALSLQKRFEDALDVATCIYPDQVFDLPGKHAKDRASVPLYDATMIAIDRKIAHQDLIARSGPAILGRLEALLDDSNNYDIIIGKPGTAKAIHNRIDLVTTVMSETLDL